MRGLKYQRRSKGELQRACLWAVEKLHLQSWDVELFLDRINEEESLAEAKGKGMPGRNHYWPDELVSHVGVFSVNCKKANVDPLGAVFHEVAHLATDPSGVVESGGLAENAMELLTNRVGWLLQELYDERGR